MHRTHNNHNLKLFLEFDSYVFFPQFLFLFVFVRCVCEQYNTLFYVLGMAACTVIIKPIRNLGQIIAIPYLIIIHSQYYKSLQKINE